MSRSAKTSLTGGILAGMAASLCCVVPLALLLVGISGAWIGNLTALEPYTPIFITLALVSLFFAYRSIFIPQNRCCSDKSVCAIPSVNRLYRMLFYIVAVMIILSIAAPYLMVFLMGDS